MPLVETHDIRLVESHVICFLRRKPRAVLRARTYDLFRANAKVAAFGHRHKGWRAAFGRPPHFVVSSVLALYKAHVVVLNTAHVAFQPSTVLTRC